MLFNIFKLNWQIMLLPWKHVHEYKGILKKWAKMYKVVLSIWAIFITEYVITTKLIRS